MSKQVPQVKYNASYPSIEDLRNKAKRKDPESLPLNTSTGDAMKM